MAFICFKVLQGELELRLHWLLFAAPFAIWLGIALLLNVFWGPGPRTADCWKAARDLSAGRQLAATDLVEGKCRADSEPADEAADFEPEGLHLTSAKTSGQSISRSEVSPRPVAPVPDGSLLHFLSLKEENGALAFSLASGALIRICRAVDASTEAGSEGKPSAGGAKTGKPAPRNASPPTLCTPSFAKVALSHWAVSDKDASWAAIAVPEAEYAEWLPFLQAEDRLLFLVPTRGK